MQKKLYRSKTDRTIAGVCAGVAEYLNIDVTVVRVLWALAAIFWAGLLAYIVWAIVIPENPTHPKKKSLTLNKFSQN